MIPLSSTSLNLQTQQMITPSINLEKSPSTFLPFLDSSQNGDAQAFTSLQNMFSILTQSNQSLVAESNRVNAAFQKYREDSSRTAQRLMEENRRLRQDLHASEARNREAQIAHQAALQASQNLIAILQNQVEALKKVMQESYEKINLFDLKLTLTSIRAAGDYIIATNKLLISLKNLLHPQ